MHFWNVGTESLKSEYPFKNCVQVVIAGTIGSEDTEQLMNVANSVFAPDRVVVTIDLGDAGLVEFWRGFNPEVLAMVEAGGMKAGGRCGLASARGPVPRPQSLALRIFVPTLWRCRA